MSFQKNISLKPYNTFGIDVQAKYFAEFFSTEELKQYLSVSELKNLPKIFLGSGSNILFTGNFNGVVLKNNIKGISLVSEDENNVYLKAGAGEKMHDVVTFCLKNNFAGIENLSLIPGTAGAAPVQNIGAYGVEIKDVLHQVEVLCLNDFLLKKFSNSDCRFGYRESIFKHEIKGKYVIISITLKLNKKPVLTTNYGVINDELKRMNITHPDIQTISEAICNIRRSKLPLPEVLGNAGSFFKNPTITAEKYEELKKKHPSIVAFPSVADTVKLAAGWLIEQCGWKGKRVGGAGVHKGQSLVLVNFGGATGDEIYRLACQIQNSVKEKFDVLLEMEVNVI